MSITQVSDHVARVTAALVEQYKNKPKVVGLLTAFTNQIQKLEDAFFPLLSLPNLGQATGAGLDLLGRIVGEPRNGRLDASYRTAIQVKILLNISSGTIDEIYAIDQRG